MQKTMLPSANSNSQKSFRTAPRSPSHLPSRLTLFELAGLVEGWLLDCEIRQLSRSTMASRRLITEKLTWFLKEQGYDSCDTPQLRQFLAYVSRPPEPGVGRWGNADRNTAHATKAVRPETVRTYHRILRTLFQWGIGEGMLTVSPLAPISAPVSRPDQVQPFSEAQITALMEAARKTNHPKRDEALLLLLLDTGLRASEICSLHFCDLDFSAKRLIVLGKGNKHRTVFFGRTAAKALWGYLREDIREKDAPIFISDRGSSSGEPLRRGGLLQLFWRLGKAARIEAARCSPHTCRHTFAVNFLRNGGNVFSLQQMLGHTALTQTNRYVALAQGDIENQHRAFSPVDHLKRKAQ